MTKPINRISRKALRQKGALQRLESNNPSPTRVFYYRESGYNRNEEINTLKKRIESAPSSIIKTKKNRSDKAKKTT
jgi:hypothetical protein